MKIASVRSTEIHCSLPVLLLIPVMAAFGRLGSFCVCCFSLLIHELAHSFTASRLGYRISSIELQPFGCVARLMREPSAPLDSAAIAAAGPLASLLLCVSGAAIETFAPNSAAHLEGFVSFNLGIAALNLLPVLPLDGGRLSEAFLQKRFEHSKAIRLLSAAGCVFGGCLFSVGTLLLLTAKGLADAAAVFPMITGLFIVISALGERKRLGMNRMKKRLEADARLRAGGALEIRAAAMSDRTSVREALAMLSGSGYNLVLVLDKNLNRLGIISEPELIASAMNGNTEHSLGFELKRIHRQI